MSTAKPFNFWDLLADPNTQVALAQMGASMVPQGEGYAGDVIGNAAINLVKSKAAQKAGEQTLGRDAVTKKLGPVTPIDKPGLNSIKSNANGSLDLDINTNDQAGLIASLGGYTPLGSEGVNRITRSPRGSLLVNYDPPKPFDIAELSELEAAPTAVRDTSKLSYTPISQSALQTEVDGMLEPWAMRRRSV